MEFKDLNIIEPILRAVAEEGYTNPTPIQAQAIPFLLNGRDVLGCAQTGTGKTAAFAIPIIQLLGQKSSNRHQRPIRSLILTPTRELALQIDDSFTAYGKHVPLSHTAIFGGVPQGRQVDLLKKGLDVLIATPGRLLDLMSQGYISLSQVEIFVLDEADRMLDMGFVNDVKKVIAKLPAKRQNLLFSATMPQEIASLAANILRDPAEVKVNPVSSTAKRIGQSVCFVEKKDKPSLLVHILADKAITRSLVFTRTKHGADKLVRVLVKAGINAAAIHGNKSQNARQKALEDFRNTKVRVLVATDIAARGIDIDDLPHVVNFDLPEVPETYVHRIGRTGRAGAEGVAVAFCDSEERADLRNIQKLIGFNIPVLQLPDFAAIVPAPQPEQEREPRPANNGRKQQPVKEKNKPAQQPKKESKPVSIQKESSIGNEQQKPAKSGNKTNLAALQPEETNCSGVVSFFNRAKGFGFILDNATKEKIFVPASQLPKAVKQKDAVIFDKARDERGSVAMNVRISEQTIAETVIEKVQAERPLKKQLDIPVAAPLAESVVSSAMEWDIDEKLSF